MMNDTIYDYIESQETEYTQPIDLNGWLWSMKDHIQTSFYYKFGRLLGGNDEMTPVKNITRPILNVQYRAEDIDAKEVTIYVDDPDAYFMSFLVKKYLDDIFVIENDLDTFFDELKESKVDYGGGLAKKMTGARPERVDLQSIAFCDQTNMMTAPIGLRHNMNPAELKEMAKVGWGDKANGATIELDDLIELSLFSKVDDTESGVENKSTGTYIEIYEVHGILPLSYLSGEMKDDKEYVRQMQIVAFYKTELDQRRGVTLFAKKEKESPFKLHKRDEVYNRALGYGGVEELFEDQVWTNYDVIRMNDMLDAASKTIMLGIGTELKSRYPNGLADMDNLEILELGEGEDMKQADTMPRNMNLFVQSVNAWEEHARTIGSAQDPMLGKTAPSGTPFRAQALQVEQGKGLHEYRKGKYARFLEEIYRDWILPHVVTEITKGAEFLSELSTDEMKFVVDQVVKVESGKLTKKLILTGQKINKEMIEAFEQKTREELVAGGNKKFIKILKGEFKKKPLRVKVSIAGASKNLADATDKFVNIFQQIIRDPQSFLQAMQIPEVAKTFNQILESSGMSPALYAGLNSPDNLAPAGAKAEGGTKTLEANATA